MASYKGYASCLLVLTLASGLCSCGSGGREETASQASRSRAASQKVPAKDIPRGTISKRRFLKKAKVICAQGFDEMNKADLAAWAKYEPDHTTKDPAILNKVGLSLLPGREKELRRLRALGLPKGGERYVYNMLVVLEEGVEEGSAEPRQWWDGTEDFGIYRFQQLASKYGLYC